VKSVKKATRKAAERSNVPCSPHVFRHTAGVWMGQADVPMQKISQFLGHTSMRVTERTCALQPVVHEGCRGCVGVLKRMLLPHANIFVWQVI
jgi:hypothetical protein